MKLTGIGLEYWRENHGGYTVDDNDYFLKFSKGGPNICFRMECPKDNLGIGCTSENGTCVGSIEFTKEEFKKLTWGTLEEEIITKVLLEGIDV